MTLWRRIVAVLTGRANAGLDRLEDPRDALEGAYRTAVAALQDARRGVADVLTSEKRLEIEADALEAAARRYLENAREAARAGDDVRARAALVRETSSRSGHERMLVEAADVRTQRLALEALVERLRERVDALRTEKVAVGARLAAAKATTRAGESVTGLSVDMHDVALTLDRVRERARDAQARAAAMSELASGTERTSAAAMASLDARLAELKAQPQARLEP